MQRQVVLHLYRNLLKSLEEAYPGYGGQGPREFVRSEIRTKFRERKDEKNPTRVTGYIRDAEQQLRMVKQAQNRVFVSESCSAPSVAEAAGHSVPGASTVASAYSKQRVFLGHNNGSMHAPANPTAKLNQVHYHTSPFASTAPRSAQTSAPPATPIIQQVTYDLAASSERTVASAISQPIAPRPTPPVPSPTPSAASLSQRERESMFPSTLGSSATAAVESPEALVSLTPAQLAKRQMQDQPWNNVLGKLSTPLRSTSKAHSPDETLHSEYIQSMKKKTTGGA